MLPGFRFLFAAIVFSMSILVFGLGAADLLRAAHEQFARNPSWHAAPEANFAQQVEATKPMLALLRIESPASEPKASANAAATDPPALPNSAEQATVGAPAEQTPADPGTERTGGDRASAGGVRQRRCGAAGAADANSGRRARYAGP